MDHNASEYAFNFNNKSMLKRLTVVPGGLLPGSAGELTTVLGTANQEPYTAAVVNESCAAGLCFSLKHSVEIVCYTLLFSISVLGNGFMFFILLRHIKRARAHLNRVYLLLLHLNIANLIVTVLHFPFKIIHSATVGFYAPAWFCPLLKFTDVFGLYLASFVLICMSIDRLFAIVRPLYSLQALRQVKIMLGLAWYFAAIFSAPQAYIFRTLQHPKVKHFYQCTSMTLPGEQETSRETAVLVNTVLNFFGCYLLPATFIIVCYAIILARIIREQEQGLPPSEGLPQRKVSSLKAKLSAGSAIIQDHGEDGRFQRHTVLRRSSYFHLRRAKSRTLRMTVAVVSAFLLFWTPYFVTVLLRFLDDGSSRGRSLSRTYQLMRSVLYTFAFFNTALNPYLYGYFSFNLRHELRALFCAGTGRRSNSDESRLQAASQQQSRQSWRRNEAERQLSTTSNRVRTSLETTSNLHNGSPLIPESL